MDLTANETGQSGYNRLAHDSTANVGTIAPAASDATQQSLFDLPDIPKPTGVEARAARDAALERIALRADPGWLAQAERALLVAIDVRGAACVDDCRDAIPPPSLPCWWCVVPRMLAARGIIRRVGSRPGVAPVTHGGDLRLWARMEARP